MPNSAQQTVTVYTYAWPPGNLVPTFRSKTVQAMSVLANATVVIDRESQDVGNPVLTDRTQVYSGNCNFQSGGGTQYRNPSGVVDIADATLVIDPDANGDLPQADVGDRATVTLYINGVAQPAVVYNVDNVSLWGPFLPHVELALKRGPVANKLQ